MIAKESHGYDKNVDRSPGVLFKQLALTVFWTVF